MAEVGMNGLTARQQKALSSLLTHPTLADAAKASGIAERSLYRYLRAPHFAECYRQARHQQVAQAVSLLQTSADQAVAVLIEIATSPTAKSTARVQAARALVEGALRATEMETLEARITELEQRLEATCTTAG